MSFDGFFLHHMTEELRRELLGGRIQKINQPFEQELVLQIRSNRQSHRRQRGCDSGHRNHGQAQQYHSLGQG